MIAALTALLLSANPPTQAVAPQTAMTPEQLAVLAIATDIEKLTHEFRQLQTFKVKDDFHPDSLAIDYGFHTHQPQGRAGWTGAVPNPDNDGLWFYIDLHDANSTAQIHTQPVTQRLCLGKKRVSFLILEGEGTNSVAGRIHAILTAHGVRPCPS